VHLRSDKAGQEPLERPLRPSPQPGPALPLTELMSEGKARPEAVAELQRSAGNAAVAQLLADDRQGLGNEEAAGNLAEAMASAGQPLDHEIRQGMESALGADLGSVRVHTGAEAHRSAQALEARAYTVGEDIVFGAGEYRPGSPSGQRTLAHELTHVVQQRSGPVDGTDIGSGIALSHPSDRFEQAAERNADRVIAGLPAAAGSDNPSAAAALPGQEASAGLEREDVVQGVWAQRQDDLDEEETPGSPSSG